MTHTHDSPRPGYPSDLADSQWYRIEPLIPPEKDAGRHRTTDPRALVNAIRYRALTGCSWRKLPEEYPPWGTVVTYYLRWVRDGVWDEICAALKTTQDAAATSASGCRVCKSCRCRRSRPESAPVAQPTRVGQGRVTHTLS